MIPESLRIFRGPEWNGNGMAAWGKRWSGNGIEPYNSGNGVGMEWAGCLTGR